MSDSRTRRPVAAVVGAGDPSPLLLAAAEELGEALVQHGFRVATGGRGGVMEGASRGAHRASAYREGDVVGVLPSTEASQANPWVDIAVPTGMGHARNVILVSMADVVIAVGGGAGTLSEMAMAWQLGKPIVGLDLGEGWSARVANTSLDHRLRDPIHRATSPAEAARLARQLAFEAPGEP